MSSPTTSRPDRRSTSTAATAPTKEATPSNWTDATKLSVRKQGPTLTATRVSAPGLARPVGHLDIPVAPGDWLISHGSQCLDVVRADLVPGPYEIVQDGTLTLTPLGRQELERTLGIGATTSAASLIQAVERLASIQIGTVKVEFTPGQLAEIKHRAEKRGHTLQQELEAAVARVSSDIFHNQ